MFWHMPIICKRIASLIALNRSVLNKNWAQNSLLQAIKVTGSKTLNISFISLLNTTPHGKMKWFNNTMHESVTLLKNFSYAFIIANFIEKLRSANPQRIALCAFTQ